MKYEKLAREIVKAIGGKENVEGLTHCITRLRFNLKDESKAKDNEIKSIDGVVTLVKNMGQYQVVIGNHVSDVYEDVMKVLGNIENTKTTKKNENLFNILISALSKMFQPILGPLAASGMLKGLAAVMVAFGLSKESGIYILTHASGEGLFQMLPMFLAWTSSTYFGLNSFTGLALGAAMVFPNLGSNMQLFNSASLLGFNIVLPVGGYASSVMPIIFTIWFASILEKQLKKIIPDVVKIFLIPFFTILITFIFSIMIIGPVITKASLVLGLGISYIFNLSGTLTAGILSASWMALVMFGLHWSVIPLGFNNLSTLGEDKILAALMVHSFVLSGVLLAILLKTKEEKVKSLSIPAFISAIFGVTEPGIYGITLPMKKPFILASVISGIVGAIGGYFDIKIFTTGGLGIFSLPSYINSNGIDSNLYVAIAIFVIGFILGFLAMLFFNIPKIYEDNKENEIKNNKQVNILSPIEGKLIKLENVNDAAFSSGQLGKGIAVYPEKGEIISTFNGEITMFFPTKHAFSVLTEDGIEVLIHVGIDTVKLDGKYFETKFKTGDKIKKGDVLLTFNKEAIEKEGYSLETPIILTNSDDYLEIIESEEKNVKYAEKILLVL